MVATVKINEYLYYADSGFTHYRYTGSNNAICLGVNTTLSDSKVEE